MADNPQTLRCLLIPFGDGQAILPNSTVVEVLPYAPPLPVERAPAWVMGNLLWRARPIPLVTLERLVHDARPQTGIRSRIVVLHALGDNAKLLNFGLLAADVPRLLNLERHEIVKDEAAAPTTGVLSWARVNDQAMVIPDLGVMEEALGAVARG